MAFRIAISGLDAAQAALNVAGNNIANAGTTGFKVSRAQFADVFATSTVGAASDAVGQGVRLSSVAQQFTQGNIALTNKPLDLAIAGEGFFVLEDTAGARSFSRSGAFGVDKDGFVVNDTAHRVIGFQAVNGAVTGVEGPLRISTANISPRATSTLTAGVNLDSTATPPTAAFDPAVPASFNDSTTTSVFDSLGVEHLASLFFRKTDVNEWETHLRIDGDNTQTTTPATLEFDSSGQLTTPMPVNYGAFTPTNGAAPFTVDFDFSESTQFESTFAVNFLSQDGFRSGRLIGLDIDDSGLALARFSNGQAKAQGQVALANFSNPEGLTAVGDTTWTESSASGPPLVGAPGTASLGLLNGGGLEESNTDLAEQLVNVIIAQRNFQANAQMIQAEDEITQTIINIR